MPAESVTEDVLQTQSEALGTWMLENGLLSSESRFSVQDAQILRWESEEPEAIATSDGEFFSGVVMVWPSSLGDTPNELFYAMARYSYIRTVEIISPEEAFAAVERGNFSEYNNMQAGDVLSVHGCALVYGSDTKGYYRPMYQFEGTRNGEPWNCLIAADEQ